MKSNIGLAWAKMQAVYGQLGVMSGIATQLMQVGVFYATVVKGWIPLPLYLLILACGLAVVLSFILRVGIKGYYAFFNKNSAVSEIERKVDLIMEHLRITENEDVEDKRQLTPKH